MKLHSEKELENTRRKLAELEKLIEAKRQSPRPTPARDISLESMETMARQLRSEIQEYYQAHQNV